ncbi:hypothetical protein FIBSPDRAFT_329154 [Athelia psychrophila]|uniref:Uncharacterized protein n=1 Tax=Athelia psychrophila TaxID=1759441 RepID=A0A167WKK6_9AGAM|nr:hypothetical protein FIBSPDRAFT_329154 [Fibularhizoctonia sp. CBS 109695]
MHVHLPSFPPVNLNAFIPLAFPACTLLLLCLAAFVHFYLPLLCTHAYQSQIEFPAYVCYSYLLDSPSQSFLPMPRRALTGGRVKANCMQVVICMLQ